MGYPGSKVTLFTKEGNPGGGDKTCPCKQFASASRDNFCMDLGMCNRTKTEYSRCYVFVILSYKLAIKLSRVVGCWQLGKHFWQIGCMSLVPKTI